MTPTVVDGLVFDLDNTLLDRQAALNRVAHDFYDEHLADAASVNREDAVALMVDWDGDGYTNREWMLSQWLAEWPRTGLTLESLAAWYRPATQHACEPDEKVNRYLAELNDRGVPWGIVTNGASSQHGKCRSAGLDQLAPFIIVSEEVGYAKPDPRIFWDALTAAGLTMPERVMFVGDNPQADIDGAKRIGMMAAWVSREKQYPVDLLPPDLTIDHVTELRDLVTI